MRVVEVTSSGTAVSHRRFVDFLSERGWIGQDILAVDWSATSLGPMERWPQSLQTTLRFVLTTRQPIVFFWGPDLHQFFNEAYAPILDGMPPDPIGAPFKVFWGEVFEGVRPYFERAIAGEGTWEQDLPLLLTRNGVTEQTYWSFSYSPLYDDGGEIVGFMNVVNETTTGVTSRQKLEATNHALALQYERTKVIADGARDYAIITIAPDQRITSWSSGAASIFGRSEAEMIGHSVEELFTPEDRAADVPRLELEAAAAEGVAPDVRWHQRPDGGRVFMDGTVKPLHNDGGGFIKIARDATADRLAADRQAALLELGDRLREVAEIADAVNIAGEILGRTLNASRAGYALIDRRLGTFTVLKDWTLPSVSSLEGQYPLSMFPATVGRAALGGAMISTNIAEVDWLTEDQAGYRAIGALAQIKVPLLDRGELEGLLFIHHADPRAWSKEEVDFAHGVADRTYAAVAKLKAEAEQRLLNQEIAHRLKNMLALVQAIVTQTLRGVTDRAPIDALEKRLGALGHAHDVLMHDNKTAAPLGTIVSAVLDSVGQRERFDIHGSPVTLGPRSALSMSLIMHELATNAMKYGALSVEGGRVSVDWEVKGDTSDTLVVRWKEAGGPPATPPSRKGFGTRLISTGLVGTGSVDLTYNSSGFAAELTAPLAQVQQS